MRSVVCLMVAFAIAGDPVMTAGDIIVGRTSDFQDNTFQGWSGGFGRRVFDQEQNRYLQLSANGFNGTGGKLGTRNESEDWTGDYVAAGVRAIGARIRNPMQDTVLEMRVTLMTDFLTTRWTSTEAVTVPADDRWHHVVFSLLEEDMTQVGFDFDNEIDPAVFAESLAAIERLHIRHQAGEPSGGQRGTVLVGTLHIDDVTALAEVPEPTWMAWGGLVLLALRRTRRMLPSVSLASVGACDTVFMHGKVNDGPSTARQP